jgi:hypothetical protein
VKFKEQVHFKIKRGQNNQPLSLESLDDIIKLSELGLKKQLSEQVIENKNDISYESVRVSSTIGKSQSANNLTHTQATQLYNDIAAIM